MTSGISSLRKQGNHWTPEDLSETRSRFHSFLICSLMLWSNITWSKSTWGGKSLFGWHFYITVCHWRKPGQGLKEEPGGRNWQRPGRNVAYRLNPPGLLSLLFVWPSTTSLVTVPPTVDWASMEIINQENAAQTCPNANLMEAMP